MLIWSDIFICVSVSVCVSVHMGPQRSEKAFKYLGAGVKGG